VNVMDLLDETRQSIFSNKARSALTILGIVVGIAAVIVMVAIGQGAQASITSSIQAAGSDLLMVMPGGGSGGGGGVRTARGGALTLTTEDMAAIAKGVQGVKAVVPELSKRYQVVAGGNNTNTSIIGTNQDYPGVKNLTIAEGSFFTPEDVSGMARIAILGATTRDDLFGVGASGVVGQRIRINGLEFRVVGVAAAKGGSGFGNADDAIYVPLTCAQTLLAGDPHLTLIDVQANTAGDMAAVQAGVNTMLLDRHHITDPTQADFSVLSQQDILATASTITGTFTIVLASIAGISLLVGGIGIMNMMLTSVTERTREIGLRKAIGAREGDISMQFLAESVALTGLGGLVGVLLGFLISWAITQSGVVQTSVSMSSVGLAFGVSFGIGVVFGYYPARRAAAMSPIEALRYQ
jgi:putative ABC transport system permease protein